MKPLDEIALEREQFWNDSPLSVVENPIILDQIVRQQEEIERLTVERDAAFRKGQEVMRERAAKLMEGLTQDCDSRANRIRNLEISE